MTLLVRDEADVVGENVRYHLERGIDHVIAMDHRSTDGTTEILRELEREGGVHLIRQDDPALRQSEWVTGMARLAASEFGADWVVNCDADEFWWPRGGTFQEILEAVPPRFGAVRGLWRHFVPRPDDGAPFHERMVVRRPSLPGGRNPYAAQVKVVHRADPNVVVRTGGHEAYGDRLVLLREWYPFEVLHFPIRGREQLERKYVVTRESVLRAGDAAHVSPHVDVMVGELRDRGVDDLYRSLVVDDEALTEGLAAGSLTLDTRLRDGLAGRELPPGAAWEPDPELLCEIDAHQDNDSAGRLRVRLDALGRRRQELDGLLVVRAGRRLARRQDGAAAG